MTKLFFTIFFLFFSSSALASDYHFHYAVGTGLSNPGSIRFGNVDWEVGLLAPGSIGIAKLFRTQGLTYMSFGFGVSNTSLNVFGSVGWQGSLFWRLNWRAELQSTVGINGEARGSGLVGINFYF